MNNRDEIMRILELGIQAPSGENAQPWRLKREGNRVWLFNRPEADQSLYNYHQNGSYIAHGAFLENITIASTALGYKVDIQTIVDSSEKDLVAIIDFKKTNIKEGLSLFPFIEKRVTNRKKYDGLPLSQDDKRELLNDIELGVRGIIIDEREKIGKLAEAASVNEMMLIENKYVHDFFFDHVRWNSEENELKPNGFYIKTLELNSQQEKGFGLLKRWGIAKILRKFGMSHAVGRDNEAIYNTASAMIGLVVKDSTPQSLILAGRMFERIWLRATKRGLSIQPTTGALFLVEGISGENKDSFSEKQREKLKAARKAIYDSLKVDSEREHVAVLFRIGHGDQPSARAARFPLDMFFMPSLTQGEKGIIQVAGDRQILIKQILDDLKTLRDNPSFQNQYALEENIAFFEAIQSFPNYIRWLVRRAPKLNRERLLELTDFPFPQWDKEMHLKLMEMESRDFPGLIAPLADRLLELIKEKTGGPFIGLHLGSGGREIDRQIIRKLIGSRHPNQIVLIGVDRSAIANELAKENIREIEPFIAIYEMEVLQPASLQEILKNEKQRHVIIFAKNDIFDLPKYFKPSSFDVVYHTLFKHHLNLSDKEKLDTQIVSLGKAVLEYDGYKNWSVIIPQTITGWRYPAFFNAELFSNFRFMDKKDLLKLFAGQKISFHPRVGTYLLER